MMCCTLFGICLHDLWCLSSGVSTDATPTATSIRRRSTRFTQLAVEPASQVTGGPFLRGVALNFDRSMSNACRLVDIPRLTVHALAITCTGFCTLHITRSPMMAERPKLIVLKNRRTPTLSALRCIQNGKYRNAHSILETCKRASPSILPSQRGIPARTVT